MFVCHKTLRKLWISWSQANKHMRFRWIFALQHQRTLPFNSIYGNLSLCSSYTFKAYGVEQRPINHIYMVLQVYNLSFIALQVFPLACVPPVNLWSTTAFICTLLSELTPIASGGVSKGERLSGHWLTAWQHPPNHVGYALGGKGERRVKEELNKGLSVRSHGSLKMAFLLSGGSSLSELLWAVRSC